MICSRLTCDQDSVANKSGCAEFELTCVNVYKTFHRGMDGKELDDLGQSARERLSG